MSSTGRSIRINGTDAALPADPRISLLDLLRETLHLHGTKKVRDPAARGACTVPVDGERIVFCPALISVASAAGRGRGRIWSPGARQRRPQATAWRRAENELRGSPTTEHAFRALAEAELEAAPLRARLLKVGLGKHTIPAGLGDLGGEGA